MQQFFMVVNATIQLFSWHLAKIFAMNVKTGRQILRTCLTLICMRKTQCTNLLIHCFVEVFITPIVKVSKGKNEISFYSMPAFQKWKSKMENSQTWELKYYKGLGTSTCKKAIEQFSDMKRHRRVLVLDGLHCRIVDSSIVLKYGTF